MIQQALEQKIRQAFAPSHLEIENESRYHSRDPQGETHFKMLVVSKAFEGLSRVDRQRAILDLYAQERAQGLHALSLRALTPAEWEASGSQLSASFITPKCKGENE